MALLIINENYNMKLWIKILLVFTFIGVGGLIYIWYYVYNKPHQNIEKSTPDFVITASECYQHYAQNQNSELSNYTGKVLQISGIPRICLLSARLWLLANFIQFNQSLSCVATMIVLSHCYIPLIIH